MISCTLQGSLDHYATSDDVPDGFCRVYVYIFTFRLVTPLVSDVRRRPRRSARSPPTSHDVAGPGPDRDSDIDMDLAEAQVRSTTRFRSTNVSPHCRPVVEQSAAGE